MGARRLPKTIAMEDRILAALADEPGTAHEVAARVGCLHCECLKRAERCSPPYGCEGSGHRPASNYDVGPMLARLERDGRVDGHRMDGRVLWSRRDPAVTIDFPFVVLGEA